MKQLWHMIERYYPWLLLLLGVDCFFALSFFGFLTFRYFKP